MTRGEESGRKKVAVVLVLAGKSEVGVGGSPDFDCQSVHVAQEERVAVKE